MVRVEGIIPWDDLEQRLRETQLLEARDGQPVYPYASADIRLENIAYADVAPTSLYVVRRNLATLATITNDLSAQGYDPLQLNGGLLLADESDSNETVGLIPPIVEETAQEGRYILDGAHRTSIGRWLGRTHFMGVLISGIRPDCPGYALPNTWRDLEIVEEVPQNPTQKKNYRTEWPGGYRSLYRDFGPLNGSHLR